MAYIVTTEQTLSEAAAISLDVFIPAAVQENDLMIMFVTQDGGGTNILVTVATGWTLLSGSQGASQTQRTVCYYKIATASETDPLLTGATEDWIVSFVVMRNVNLVTPISDFDITNSANSTSSFLDSGALTTTQDNVVILEAWGFDGSGKLVPEIPNNITNLTKESNIGACVQYVGYRNFLTMGTTVPIRMLNENSSEGGTVIALAVRDADPLNPKMGPDCTRAFDPIKRYGGISTQLVAANGFIRHDLPLTWLDHTNIAATTIDGVDVAGAATAFIEQSIVSTISTWGSFTSVSQTTSGVNSIGRWVGATHTMASVDLTAKILSLEFNVSSTVTSRFGVKGCIIYLQSSNGGWAAYQLSRRQGIFANVPITAFISIDNATPLETAGSFNASDVVQVAYLWHKITNNASAIAMRVKNLITLDRVTYVDGSLEAPATPTFARQVLGGNGTFGIASIQGAGQAILRQAIRLGDGTRNIFYDATATSQELPLNSDKIWQVPTLANGARFRLNATANSTINLTSCIISSESLQKFIIEATSSTAATYNFAGLSLIGYQVENDTTVTINSTTFSKCVIQSNAGGLLNSNIGSQAAPVLSSDPAKLIGNDFIANSLTPTYGIELNTVGTYNFNGNTFSGYGANASSSAFIFNNSGGLITLNLNPSDQTPTVTNGVGASTVLASTPVNISATVLADSRVQIFNVTTSTEIENINEPTTSYAFSVTSQATVGDVIRLRLTKKGIVPVSLNAVFSATGISFLPDQVADEVYDSYGIDGATVTKFEIDLPNLDFDLNIIANFSGTELYAWYSNMLTTEDGVRSFFNAITPIDAANLRLNNSIVDVRLDNQTASNVFQNDNIRIFRSDETYPVVNPTSGGGGIDVNWRNVVFTITSGSGLSAAQNTTLSKLDDLTENVSGLRFTTKAVEQAGGSSLTVGAIADAVWDEPIAGHLTAGSTGATLNGASAPSAGTVASAVRTELTTELARIDVATSTRNSVVPTNLTAAQVRTELTTELARIDVATSTRSTLSQITTAQTAIIAEIDAVPAEVWNTTEASITTPNSIGVRLKLTASLLTVAKFLGLK